MKTGEEGRTDGRTSGQTDRQNNFKVKYPFKRGCCEMVCCIISHLSHQFGCQSEEETPKPLHPYRRYKLRV